MSQKGANLTMIRHISIRNMYDLFTGGLCSYPNPVEQNLQSEKIRKEKCSKVFFLPESGSFDDVIDEIKSEIRRLALADDEVLGRHF